jgi:hypothetical protein
MARVVQNVMPSAMVRGRDGYLRVFYDKIGIKIETCDQWVASGEHVLTSARQRDHKVFCGSNQNRKRFSDTAGQTKHRLAKPRDIII